MAHLRGVLGAGVLLLGQASPVPAAVLAADPPPRPSIVLLMCDDLGWGDAGFQGATTVLTPHLDQMAADGVVFRRFYAASPVCSPTRGSLLTGRHPSRYGIHGANVGHLPVEERTLPELLREQGYATGHFGKWHLGTLTTEVKDANRGGPRGAAHFTPPGQHGYDSWFVTESKVPTFDPLWRPENARTTWWNPIEDLDEALPYGTRYWDHHGKEVKENTRGDDSRVIMDRVVPFVREAVAAERPFLAVVWFHAPHLPVVAGAEHTAPYADLDRYSQHYFGSISAMDEQVGRLSAELAALGVERNTLIAFCSDNGPEGRQSDAPGATGGLRGRKRDLFEGGVRVPAFFLWPEGIPAGGVTGFAASTSDLLPTIMDVLGLAVPADRPMDGLSLRPAWSGEARDRSHGIGFHYKGSMAWIEQQWKLLHLPADRSEGNNDAWKYAEERWLLFDLEADPGELTDRSNTHPDQVERMRAELLRWRESCQGPPKKP